MKLQTLIKTTIVILAIILQLNIQAKKRFRQQ
jgi:hypothetical protein